jgi:hypothetical protein
MRRINMISLSLLYEPYIIKPFVPVCVWCVCGCVCVCNSVTSLIPYVSDVTGHNVRLMLVYAVNLSSSLLYAAFPCLSEDFELFRPALYCQK